MRGAVACLVCWWPVFAFLGATLAAGPPQSNTADDDRTASAQQKAEPIQPGAPVAGADQPPGEDFLAQALEMNSAKHPLPEPSFRAGHVQDRKFDPEAIKRGKKGFTIQMPSGTAVATPAVDNGRLYVSGGFSCMEFYCFDAKTGKFLWGKELDDDGASAPVIHDETVIFNTESCTIFALDAADGKLRWAHWLGDPLMSVPAAAGGRVFTTYPVNDAPGIGKFEVPAAEGDHAETEAKTEAKTAQPKSHNEPAGQGNKPLVPTHVLIAFDVRSGKVLWQRWIDTECMSAPVADGDRLYVTTLSGTLYELNQSDGTILGARRLRATSAPVPTKRCLYYTRRADSGEEGQKVSEAVVRLDRASGLEDYLTCSRPAPYLDWRVQVEARSTVEALQMEMPNSIGGGFGGGFGSGSQSGLYSLPPETLTQTGPNQPAPSIEADSQEPAAPAQTEPDAPKVSAMDQPPPDLLAVTERVAADVIGQGNVSMLQSYHGSRVLPVGNRNVACMGDLVVCVAADLGKLLWSLPLDGNLKKEGGYLASPPVLAGGQVFLSTLSGEILQLDPRTGRQVKSYAIGSPMRYPPLVVDGRLYATTQDGKVVCVDTGNRQLTGWPQWCRNSANANVARPR